MFISVEHLLAEGEESLARHHIILQHDTLVDQGESPSVGDESRRVTAHVAFLIEAVHLALPVNVFGNAAASLDTGFVLVGAGAVLIEEQAGRTRLLHLVENLLKGFHAAEEDEQNRHVMLGWMQFVHGVKGQLSVIWNRRCGFHKAGRDAEYRYSPTPVSRCPSWS